MDEMSKTPVCVAHADPIIAAGIQALLENDGRFYVFRESGDAAPGGGNFVIADRSFALEVLANRKRQPGRPAARPRLLIVSQLDRAQEIRTAVTAGVEGYVLHSCSADELLDAAVKVAGGQRYIASPILERLTESLTHEPLTARETEVLELVAAGLCNKSIARELGISMGTVKSHVRAILVKLSASSRGQAAYQAQARGLIDSTHRNAHAGMRRTAADEDTRRQQASLAVS